MALLGATEHDWMEGHSLRLADYCCRCGKMFAQDEPIALIDVVNQSEPELPIARPAHREGCVSVEDKVLMIGLWHYDVLATTVKPKGRR